VGKGCLCVCTHGGICARRMVDQYIPHMSACHNCWGILTGCVQDSLSSRASSWTRAAEEARRRSRQRLAGVHAHIEDGLAEAAACRAASHRRRSGALLALKGNLEASEAALAKRAEHLRWDDLERAFLLWGIVNLGGRCNWCAS